MKIKKKIIWAAVFIVLAYYLIMEAEADSASADKNIIQSCYSVAVDKAVILYSPFMAYADSDWKKNDFSMKIWNKAWDLNLFADFVESDFVDKNYLCEYLQNKNDQGQSQYDIVDPQNENIYEYDNMLEEAVIKENSAATENMQHNEITFIPVQTPAAVYSRQQLADSQFIKETFYAEDPTTKIKPEQLDYNTLMGFDAVIKQDNSKPQILVYHTHSQEKYIDSAENDDNTSIMGVGEHLCDILRTKYGYNVIHHMGKYDVKSRDYAYSNAMAGLEQILAENPSIEVIIDLHRDETNADTKLVTQVQGMQMARFMFFNGLSYTRELGEITRLPNPYLQDNLSFAFQMQLVAEEYYPGLTRRIYLKGYRYNMHYRPKTLLIELGSQTNTVEEAMNSCEPIAHIISKVLNGENK